MKSSLIVCLMFCAGCVLGAVWKPEMDFHPLSMYVLYALMWQVGVSIGSHKNLKQLFAGLSPKMLFIPLGTVVGTLTFSAVASLLLRDWNAFDCMAVGYAIDPTLVETIQGHVGVETQSPLTLGMTVLDSRHHHVWTQLPVIEIGAKADYHRFLRLLKQLVLA